LPFESEYLLKTHYAKHKNEFTFSSENEYQEAADAFMSSPVKPPTHECFRVNDDRVRFDRNTKELCIQAKSGWLKTFHRASEKFILQAYLKWECGRNLP
jgi:pyocin large subunit-like protein